MKQVDWARDLKAEATFSHQVGEKAGGALSHRAASAGMGTENTKIGVKAEMRKLG